MKLAVVLGQVVSTIKHSGFSHDRLLIIDFIDENSNRLYNTHVALDAIGAGVGEIVLVVQGSSARKTINMDTPVDMSVVGIVDEVVVNNQVTYHK